MKTVQLVIPTEDELMNSLPKEDHLDLYAIPRGSFHGCYLESLERMIRAAQRPDVQEPILAFYPPEKRGNTWFWGTRLIDAKRQWTSASNFYLENTSQEVEGGGILWDIETGWIRVVGY